MMLDWPKLIKMSAEWQFKVGTKATLILDSVARCARPGLLLGSEDK